MGATLTHLELLLWTAEYIDGEWYKKPAFVQNPMLSHFHPNEWEYKQQEFPPYKIGVTLEDITQGAEELTNEEALKRVNANIEDSTDTQVIEFCSYTGTRFAHGFAKRHPNTQTIMVDKIEREQLSNALYVDAFTQHLRKLGRTEQQIKEIVHGNGFERYQKEAPENPDVQMFMKNLFYLNGTPNMKYLHQFLTENLDQLKPQLDQHKKTYAIGWNCPADVGILALQHAAANEAESIALTISGMEHITRTTPLSRTKLIQNWQELMQKARAKKYHTPDKPPYDYRNPEQKRLGFALKHLQILDILVWLEEQGYHTRQVILDTGTKRNYNMPEHFITAWKEKDLLRQQ